LTAIALRFAASLIRPTLSCFSFGIGALFFSMYEISPTLQGVILLSILSVKWIKGRQNGSKAVA
jgi:hypothetical protein